MQCPGDRCCVNTGWPRARTGAAGGGRAGKGWRWLAGTNGHIMAPIKQSLQSREAATSPAQAAAALLFDLSTGGKYKYLTSSISPELSIGHFSLALLALLAILLWRAS